MPKPHAPDPGRSQFHVSSFCSSFSQVSVLSALSLRALGVVRVIGVFSAVQCTHLKLCKILLLKHVTRCKLVMLCAKHVMRLARYALASFRSWLVSLFMRLQATCTATTYCLPARMLAMRLLSDALTNLLRYRVMLLLRYCKACLWRPSHMSHTQYFAARPSDACPVCTECVV